MSDKKCIGNCIGKNEKTIHPFNLKIIENLKNNIICPSKNYYDKKTKKTLDVSDDCNDITKNEILNFMDKPYVYINNFYLLHNVFEINEVDDILLWVNNNISKPTNYITRIINLWIKTNLKELKKYQQLLVKIMGDIIVKKKLIDIKNKNKYLNNILPQFVKLWMKQINHDNFYFDIFYDFAQQNID